MKACLLKSIEYTRRYHKTSYARKFECHIHLHELLTLPKIAISYIRHLAVLKVDIYREDSGDTGKVAMRLVPKVFYRGFHYQNE